MSMSEISEDGDSGTDFRTGYKREPGKRCIYRFEDRQTDGLKLCHPAWVKMFD